MKLDHRVLAMYGPEMYDFVMARVSISGNLCHNKRHYTKLINNPPGDGRAPGETPSAFSGIVHLAANAG
jgi:hypothetical protein